MIIVAILPLFIDKQKIATLIEDRLKNDFEVNNKLFTQDNKFKGVSGVFEINNQKINHILTFYRVEDGKFKKIF